MKTFPQLTVKLYSFIFAIGIYCNCMKTFPQLTVNGIHSISNFPLKTSLKPVKRIEDTAVLSIEKQYQTRFRDPDLLSFYNL